MPSPADLVDAVKEQLRSAVVDWPTLSIIVEPGRSLVGDAGTFITKVLGWKRNGSQKYFTAFLLRRVYKLLYFVIVALMLFERRIVYLPMEQASSKKQFTKVRFWVVRPNMK